MCYFAKHETGCSSSYNKSTLLVSVLYASLKISMLLNDESCSTCHLPTTTAIDARGMWKI